MKKYITILAALLAAALLGGCTTAQEETTAAATLGRVLVVDDSGVVFWGSGPYLCSGLLDENGHIYDVVIESQSRTDLLTVAAYGSYLYLASEDGLYRYLMADMTSGSVTPELITTHELDDGFEIFEDVVYYCYGSTLYSVPVTGGDPQKVAKDVDCFTVTADGIYYAASDGGLYLTAPDGSSQQRLTETEDDCTFCLAGNTIFYRCEKNDQIFQYSLKDGSVSVVNKRSPLSDYCDLWATEDVLLYETSGYDTYTYTLSTGEERMVTDEFCFPDKEEGFLYGTMLYAYDPDDFDLYEYDLAAGTLTITNIEETLQASIQAHSGSQSSASAGIPSGYDILSNVQRQNGTNNLAWLGSDYFLLSVPSSLSWHWEQIDSCAFSLYYTPAQEAGYGGHLVTIRAYPLGDTSFQDAPSWALAGQTDTLQYVAFFPTDVQFDPDDTVQASEYCALLSYLQKIETKAGTCESPFTCENIGRGG